MGLMQNVHHVKRGKECKMKNEEFLSVKSVKSLSAVLSARVSTTAEASAKADAVKFLWLRVCCAGLLCAVRRLDYSTGIWGQA